MKFLKNTKKIKKYARMLQIIFYFKKGNKLFSGWLFTFQETIVILVVDCFHD